MVKMNKTDKRNLSAAYLIIAVLMVIPALRLHMSMTVDELGTFANSALLAGYDWTDAVHSAGDYYYKYGTALFYTLPYIFIKDSIVLYRVLMAINGLLLGTTALMAYLVCRKHMGVKSENQALAFALAGAGVPAALLHCIYGRADYVLVMMPWLVLLCLLEANAAQSKSKKILFSVFAALGAIYTYMSHSRGLVMVIALFLTVICARLIFKIRAVHVPAYLIATLLGLIADRELTSFFKKGIWGTYGAGHASMEALHLGDLRKIFTFTGIKVLLKAVIGWCYTIFTSTVGLVLIGLIAALIILVCALRKKKEIKEQEVLAALLGILNFLGSMALGILFFYSLIYKNYIGTYTKRADRMFYERYMAGTLGILCLLGLYVLFFRKDLLGIKSKITAFAAFAVSALVFARYIAPYMDRYAFDRKMVCAINAFRGIVEPISFSLSLMGGVSLVLFVLWLLLLRKGKGRITMGIILCSYLVIFAVNCRNVRLQSDNSGYAKVGDVYELISGVQEISVEYPDILVLKKAQPVKVYQPMLKEFRVINKNMEDYQEIENMMIICKGSLSSAEEWGGKLYQFEGLDYQTQNKDVVYVKGEALKDRLESLGIVLTEFKANIPMGG